MTCLDLGHPRNQTNSSKFLSREIELKYPKIHELGGKKEIKDRVKPKSDGRHGDEETGLEIKLLYILPHRLPLLFQNKLKFL